ncbi:acyl carrier protein phosphodiesterase [Wenyingzhuangia sp. IMCC45533]
MNFLAHLYLASSNKNIIIGNFIADNVKGSKIAHFSKDIQFGIKMHRAIDTFTDEHPIFRQSKRRLDDKYKLYKGVIIDILYDHFLAKNWLDYSNVPLSVFSQGVYQLLNDNYDVLPTKTQHLLPYMTQQNWLYMYRNVFGITSILHDMNVRTKGISKMNEAVVDLEDNYLIFEQDFTNFFAELQLFCTKFLQHHDSENIK